MQSDQQSMMGPGSVGVATFFLPLAMRRKVGSIDACNLRRKLFSLNLHEIMLLEEQRPRQNETLPEGVES